MRQRGKQQVVRICAGLVCLFALKLALAKEPPKPVLESTPNSADTAYLEAIKLISLGNGELERNRPDAAIERFNQVITMDVPNGVVAAACLARGNAYRVKGAMDLAMRDYEQALRLNPQNPLGYMYRGLTFVVGGDHERALKDLSEAVRLDPKMYRAYYNRSGEYAILGNWEAARRDIDRALTLAPEYPLALARRGAIFGHDGKLQEARADFEQALKLDPSLWLAYGGLAQVCSAQRKFTEAVSIFEDVLRRQVPHPENWLASLAWIRATCSDDSVRDGAKAKQEAQQACELSHWQNSRHVQVLAAAFAEAGDFQNAINYQWLAIKLEQDDTTRAEAEQRLGLYQGHHPYRETKPSHLFEAS